MTRLARYLAGWLMSKHHLALDAALVAEERDRWEAEARRAAKERDEAEAIAYERYVSLLAAKAEADCLNAALDGLAGPDQ